MSTDTIYISSHIVWHANHFNIFLASITLLQAQTFHSIFVVCWVLECLYRSQFYHGQCRFLYGRFCVQKLKQKKKRQICVTLMYICFFVKRKFGKERVLFSNKCYVATVSRFSKSSSHQFHRIFCIPNEHRQFSLGDTEILCYLIPFKRLKSQCSSHSIRILFNPFRLNKNALAVFIYMLYEVHHHWTGRNVISGIPFLIHNITPYTRTVYVVHIACVLRHF